YKRAIKGLSDAEIISLTRWGAPVLIVIKSRHSPVIAGQANRTSDFQVVQQTALIPETFLVDQPSGRQSGEHSEPFPWSVNFFSAIGYGQLGKVSFLQPIIYSAHNALVSIRRLRTNGGIQ